VLIAIAVVVSPVAAQPALTNASVIKMVQTGAPQEAVVKAIAEAPAVEFSFLYMDELTKNGVSDDVVKAMAARAYGRPVPGYKAPSKDAVPAMASVAPVVAAAAPVTAMDGPSGDTTAPQAETAKIYVYRPKTLVDLGATPAIYCDSKEIHSLQTGTFLSWNIPAGKHLIKAGNSATAQTVDFQPGKKYFFKFNHKNFVITSITGKPPVSLSPVPEGEAAPEMKKLKPVVLQ
jgi:hypothetical protein